MKRSSPIIVRLTESTQVVRVLLEMDPTETGTLDHRKAKFDLLRMMSEQPELSQCQGVDFEKVTVYYDGSKWMAECAATVKGVIL